MAYGRQEHVCTEEYTGRESRILNCVFTTFYSRLGLGVTVQSADHHFGIGFRISEGRICLGWISDLSGSRRTVLSRCVYVSASMRTCSSSTDAASIKPIVLSDVSGWTIGSMLSPSILTICVESTILEDGTDGPAVYI